MNMADGFVPGTRYPIQCDICRKQRIVRGDLITCGCICSFWMRYRPNQTPGESLRELMSDCRIDPI